ncbi:MAG: hypothetical protein ABJE47_10450 [bacterium]
MRIALSLASLLFANQALAQSAEAKPSSTWLVSLVGAMPAGDFPNSDFFDYDPGIGARVEWESVHHTERLALRASGEVLRFTGSSQSSVTVWSAQVGGASYGSALKSIIPYAIGMVGIATSAIDNCGIVHAASADASSSASCNPTRTNVAATLGVGVRQEHGPFFVEARYGSAGPHLASMTGAIGIVF